MLYRKRRKRIKVEDICAGGSLHAEVLNAALELPKANKRNVLDKKFDTLREMQKDQRWKAALDPGLVAVDTDGLSARFISTRPTDSDRTDIFHGRVMGALKTCDPFSYFEVTAYAEENFKCAVRVGLSHEVELLGKFDRGGFHLIGNNSRSFALCTSSGSVIFRGESALKSNLTSACSIQSGDVIGCGFVRNSSKVFFTVNGELFNTVHVVFKGNKVTYPLYPCASLCNPGERIEANFGNKPFKIAKEKLKQILCETETKTESACVSSDVAFALVEDYLELNGYHSTLSVLREKPTSLNSNAANIAQDASDPQRSLACLFSDVYSNVIGQEPGAWQQDLQPVASVVRRGQLRGMIVRGEAQKALTTIVRCFPKSFYDYMEKNSESMTTLRRQIFIELVREKKLLDAVNFSRMSLDSPSAHQLIPLVAFGQSTLPHFNMHFKLQYRNHAADAVNDSIIAATRFDGRMYKKVENSDMVDDGLDEDENLSIFEDDERINSINSMADDNKSNVDCSQYATDGDEEMAKDEGSKVERKPKTRNESIYSSLEALLRYLIIMKIGLGGNL